MTLVFNVEKEDKLFAAKEIAEGDTCMLYVEVAHGFQEFEVVEQLEHSSSTVLCRGAAEVIVSWNTCVKKEVAIPSKGWCNNE